MKVTGTALLASIVLSCGPSASPPPARPPSQTPEADLAYRPRYLPWWRGLTPKCPFKSTQPRGGEKLTLYVCDVPGMEPNLNQQNDVARLALCLHEAVSLYGRAPAGDKVDSFLRWAQSQNISACTAIRPKAALIAYDGRQLSMERIELPTTAGANAATSPAPTQRILYRFGCDDCHAAGETVVEVDRPVEPASGSSP